MYTVRRFGSLMMVAFAFGCGSPVDPLTPSPSDQADPTDLVFAPDVLHRIEILVDDVSGLGATLDEGGRVPCTLVFDGVTLQNVGIRLKGGIGSASGLDGKPGFSVKFNEYVPGQKLHGLKKLILNNAIQDPTFLSEHLGYEISRSAGVPASRTSHGIVTLNGFTYGIYVIKEPVSKQFLARNFGAENDDGNLYEGPCCSDFVEDPNFPALDDEIEETRTRDDIIALRDIIVDAPDDAFAAQLATKLDVDRYLTAFALDAMFWHWDGYSYAANNWYLYNNPADGRFVFLPHGMDQLFQDLAWDPLAEGGVALASRVREVPALDARYRQELTRIASQVWNVPAMQARVDRVDATLHTNPPSDERTQGDLASFDANRDAVKDALEQRRVFVENALGAQP